MSKEKDSIDQERNPRIQARSKPDRTVANGRRICNILTVVSALFEYNM